MTKAEIRAGVSAFLRKTKLSDSEIADRVGVARTVVWRWRTKEQCPDLESVVRIADTFRVTTDSVVGRK